MNPHSSDRDRPEPAGPLESPPPEPGPDRDHLEHRALAASDASLARITEDLIDILIRRGLIQITDFVPEAQAKLLERRQQREALGKRLDLLDDDRGVI